MSNTTNEILLLRANDLVDELTGHPSRIDQSILKAIEANDMDNLYQLVTKAEAELAREHYFNNGLIGNNDVY